MALLDRLLHKPRHDEVAAQVDVLADVQSRPWRAESQLQGFRRFSWHVAPNGPLGAGLDAHGRVAMRLQPVGEVVERCRVSHLARGQATRQVGDFVGDGVPHAAVLLG